MKLKTMRASFGALDRETLELGEGLTVIEARNEGGKSTWAGFLKAMLYGIDTRDRDKKGHLADKNRYQPWSGAPMEGEMTLEWWGRDITIRRGKQGNNPFGAFSAVYTGTEEPVPGMTGENCGELLTGVGREVFERSAFIGQSAMAVSSTPELEKRIAALVSSGEEDVSYSQAEGRLREWLNRRKVNKTVGLIPKLEGELEENARTLAHLEQVTAAIARGEEERAALDRARQELEGEQWVHKRLAQRDLNRRFAQAQEEFEAAQAAAESVKKDQVRFKVLPERDLLKRAQGELQYLKVLDEEIKQGEVALKEAEEAYVQAEIKAQDELFNGLSADEAAMRVQTDLTKQAQAVERARKLHKRERLLTPLGLLFILGGIGCEVLVRTLLKPLTFYYDAVCLSLFVLGLILLIADMLTMSQRKKALGEASDLLARYKADSPEAVDALLQDYRARCQGADEAAQHTKAVRGALNDRKARKENGRSDLFDFVHTFAPEVTDQFGCSAALSLALGLEDREREANEKLNLTRRRRDDLEAQGGRMFDTLEMIYPPQRSPEETETDLAAIKWELEQVNRALDMARGEQKAVGDPAALSARQEQLQEELGRRSREYQALSVAQEALKAANVRLQERFSPELNRLAGAWMEKLTGGKYASISLNKELEASATEKGGLTPHKALALSRGTADQLYLAVRLAVSQLCLPGEDPAPLVLDDALAFFDDERMALALECLAGLAKERQVLLFTCHSREARALAGREGTSCIRMK